MLTSLIRKYRQKGVLIDTNLLIGYIVGSMNPRYLATCHATTKFFGTEDFPILQLFLSQFKRVITTPHVLTEVSNLSHRIPSNLQNEFRSMFRVAIGKLIERFKPSRSVSADDDFLRFGLTDTAISAIAPSRFLVLTDDLGLFGILQKRKVDVVNFNHVRTQAWRIKR